jgi:hypothetical protein
LYEPCPVCGIKEFLEVAGVMGQVRIERTNSLTGRIRERTKQTCAQSGSEPELAGPPVKDDIVRCYLFATRM